MRAFTQNTFARGVVQLTADNPPEVRWTIVIHYGGEDRWRLECVQMGGRGSRKGLFGVCSRSRESARLTLADLDCCGEGGSFTQRSSVVLQAVRACGILEETVAASAGQVGGQVRRGTLIRMHHGRLRNRVPGFIQPNATSSDLRRSDGMTLADFRPWLPFSHAAQDEKPARIRAFRALLAADYRTGMT